MNGKGNEIFPCLMMMMMMVMKKSTLSTDNNNVINLDLDLIYVRNKKKPNNLIKFFKKVIIRIFHNLNVYVCVCLMEFFFVHLSRRPKISLSIISIVFVRVKCLCVLDLQIWRKKMNDDENIMMMFSIIYFDFYTTFDLILDFDFDYFVHFHQNFLVHLDHHHRYYDSIMAVYLYRFYHVIVVDV